MKISYPIHWRRSSVCLSLLLATTACELQPNPIPDAGATDAGEVDADKSDAGETDAGESDSSVEDAGITCADPSQCSDPMNECLVGTCEMEACGIAAVPSGTPTLAGQLAGDCRRKVCDGAGTVAIVNDDNDPVDDLNDCTADTCSSGQHVFTPIAGTCAQSGGTMCGDPAGPNAGQCVECNVDADCTTMGYVCDLAGGTNTCVPATCSDGAQNGNETGVDCGGDACGECIGLPCQTSTDCQSGFCDANTCAPCSSHLDCVIGDYCDPATYGGMCVADKPSGGTCNAVEECQSGNCTSNVCCTGACSPCTSTIGLPHPPVPRFVARIGDKLGDSAVGDLNGDGVPDLAVVDSWFSNGFHQGVRILHNQGNGHFAEIGKIDLDTEPGTIALADLDANGALDVVGLHDAWKDLVTVLYNLGNGSFAPPIEYPTPARPTAFVIANINGDGLPDIITAHNFKKEINVLLNQGNMLFGAAATITVNEPGALAAADLNGDGFDDVVYASNGKLSMLMNQGNATFAPPVDYLVGVDPDRIATGDLNGDGLLDIVLGTKYGVDVMLNQGNGTFGAPITYPAGFWMSDIAVADVDGDNLLDVVTIYGGEQYGNVAVLRNQGNGVLAPAVNYASIYGGHSIRTMVAIRFGQPTSTRMGKPTLASSRPIGPFGAMTTSKFCSIWGMERTRPISTPTQRSLTFITP